MTLDDLDQFDRRILAVLQTDGDAFLEAIAQRVHLSPTAVCRRIKKLEKGGVILKRVALLSPRALGLSVTGFVRIRTSDHSEGWTEAFERKVAAMDEVVELHRMAGETDYMLKVVADDLAAYDALYRRLIRLPGLVEISASLSMDSIKVTTALPLAA